MARLSDYQGGFVEANGIRLHYTEWPGPAEHPVLLVHGLGSMAESWNPVAADLSGDYRVICVDLRGHGDSDWAMDGYRMESFAADVRGLTQSLNMWPFHYVGHSLGGRVGMVFAGEYPDAIRSLILSDTGPETSREALAKMQHRLAQSPSMSSLRGFDNREAALEHTRVLNPDWLPESHSLYVDNQFRVNWVGKWVPKADPELIWLVRCEDETETSYLWTIAERVEAPTLLLRGSRSYSLSVDVAQRMLATIRNSQLLELDAGHAISREQPQEFVRVVRDFLSHTRATGT